MVGGSNWAKNYFKYDFKLMIVGQNFIFQAVTEKVPLVCMYGLILKSLRCMICFYVAKSVFFQLSVEYQMNKSSSSLE